MASLFKFLLMVLPDFLTGTADLTGETELLLNR